jgi:hypothetical protein
MTSIVHLSVEMTFTAVVGTYLNQTGEIFPRTVWTARPEHDTLYERHYNDLAECE